MQVWLALIPLSLALAWQDWKSQQVNIVLAIITVFTLALSAQHVYQSLWVFGFLWLYRYFRKAKPNTFQETPSLKSKEHSIQLIDIALFSLGAGYFSINYFSAYCLLTAIVLVILAKITHKKKLPFMVAWTMGFWGTYFFKIIMD